MKEGERGKEERERGDGEGIGLTIRRDTGGAGSDRGRDAGLCVCPTASFTASVSPLKL